MEENKKGFRFYEPMIFTKSKKGRKKKKKINRNLAVYGGLCLKTFAGGGPKAIPMPKTLLYDFKS